MRKSLKFVKFLFRLLLLAVVVLALFYIAPYLHNRFFGPGNAQWISERFSEELKEQNELVVYEVTLTGKETVSQTAWLIGTVQKVQIPYSYTASFSIDLSQSRVQAADNAIEVRLPPPRAFYSKLTVDEANMKRNDWLYPLTPERYAGLKEEVEKKLYDECANNPAYLDSAWAFAVEKMEALFHAFAEQLGQGEAVHIVVIMEEPAAIQPSPESDSASQSTTGAP